MKNTLIELAKDIKTLRHSVNGDCYLGQPEEINLVKNIETKFAELLQANSGNAVAWMDENGRGVITETHRQYLAEHYPKSPNDKTVALCRCASLANKPDVTDFSWECNQCGSQEFTSGLSESDLKWLACTNCGGEEFHKAITKG